MLTTEHDVRCRSDQANLIALAMSRLLELGNMISATGNGIVILSRVSDLSNQLCFVCMQCSVQCCFMHSDNREHYTLNSASTPTL